MEIKFKTLDSPVGLFEFTWLQLSDTYIWLKEIFPEKCTHKKKKKQTKQNDAERQKSKIHSNFWNLTSWEMVFQIILFQVLAFTIKSILSFVKKFNNESPFLFGEWAVMKLDFV